jgi:Multiubiquitin
MSNESKSSTAESGAGVGEQDRKSVQIIVNGRVREVSTKELTFVQLVNLAFDDAVFNEITVYTITFKRGDGPKPKGTLVEGETVKIKKDMVFNVKRTDKS